MPRRNGLDGPHEPLQVAAWVLHVVLPVLALVFVAPTLTETAAEIALLVALVAVLVATCAAGAVATVCNPADTMIRPGHTHPDGDHLYCPLCRSNVRQGSKHCRICDKCVSGFDHHCKWLNNCVGEKNYRSFFVYVSGIFVLSLWLVGVGLYLFVDLQDEGSESVYFIRAKDAHSSMTLTGFQTVVGLLAFMGIPVLLLIGQLLFFHIHLIVRGITTYEFILRQRAKKDKAKKAAAAAARPPPPGKTVRMAETRGSTPEGGANTTTAGEPKSAPPSAAASAAASRRSSKQATSQPPSRGASRPGSGKKRRFRGAASVGPSSDPAPPDPPFDAPTDDGNKWKLQLPTPSGSPKATGFAPTGTDPGTESPPAVYPPV